MARTHTFRGSLREYRQWRQFLRQKYGKGLGRGGKLTSTLVNRRVAAVARVA